MPATAPISASPGGCLVYPRHCPSLLSTTLYTLVLYCIALWTLLHCTTRRHIILLHTTHHTTPHHTTHHTTPQHLVFTRYSMVVVMSQPFLRRQKILPTLIPSKLSPEKCRSKGVNAKKMMFLFMFFFFFSGTPPLCSLFTCGRLTG